MPPDRNTKTLLRQWVINCAAGEFIGMGVAGTLAIAVNGWVGEPYTPGQKALVLAVMLLAGTIEGSAVAFFQWRMLRHLFPAMSLRRWWQWTVAIALIGWTVGMLPSLFFAPAASGSEPAPAQWMILTMAAAGGAVGGAAFGWFQSFELRKHTTLWRSWIAANAIGWMVAMVIIFLGATWPSSTTPTGYIILSAVVAGGLGGMAIGLSTGFVLKQLLPHRTRVAHKLSL